MNKLIAKYNSWSEHGKNLFILVVIAILGSVISAAFILLDNIGVLFGWLLGSAVNIFAYVSIYKGASYLLNSATNPNQGYWSILWGFLRLLLYAGVLILSGFASFKWGSLSHGYCNMISTALALMPTWITLIVATMIRSTKEAKKEQQKPNEIENKPSEGDKEE